jgi:N-acetylmuramoyl-L-alanine amidase
MFGLGKVFGASLRSAAVPAAAGPRPLNLLSGCQTSAVSSLMRLGLPCSATILTSLVLAGCAMNPEHVRTSHPTDWQNEERRGGSTGTATTPAPPLSLPLPALSRNALTILPINQPTLVWKSLRQWSFDHGLPAPIALSVGTASVSFLAASNRIFRLQAGKDTTTCDGIEIKLGFPPQMTGGEIFVHSLDLEKNLQPLLANNLAVAAKEPKCIVIDPGHGGEDAGVQSFADAHSEKYYTLDWGQRMAALLSSKGWQVWLTRTNDSDVALSNRVLFAESHKADLYVSLHFNSALPDHIQSGLETYCLTPAGMHSTVTRGYSDDPAVAFVNNAFDADNIVMACCVHGALLRATGARDRGVRRARFPAVLRNQQRPAILIEGGYLSNPSEARHIANPEYRQKLAEAVVLALSTDDRRFDRVVEAELVLG